MFSSFFFVFLSFVVVVVVAAFVFAVFPNINRVSSSIRFKKSAVTVFDCNEVNKRTVDFLFSRSLGDYFN